MTGTLITTQDNSAWLNRELSHKTSTLSVLVPFYKDDPRALISALSADAPKGIELILFDDGMPDQALNKAVTRTIQALTFPARLITARHNLGRAAGRNHLAHHARASWVLYLDSDMDIPSHFLSNWLDWAGSEQADIYYGGFDLPIIIAPEHRLHAALAQAGDVHDAASRDAGGAHAMASSNLLVRRSVLMNTPFDEGFSGWGWEDVDWTLRAGEYARLMHVDLSAHHKGLQTVETLLAKFEEGAKNFARFLSRHPDAHNRPAAKLAKLLKVTPFKGLQKSLYARLAKAELLPLRLRVMALKFYRAMCAAQALGKVKS